MLSPEQQQLRATAREFARRELEPEAEAWDRARVFPREAMRRLADLGFLGLLVPEGDGGSGFDTVGFCLAVEEISRSVPALGLLLSIHNGPVCHLVRTAASPAAREDWLPRLASGEALGAFALSEEGAGSDSAAVRATFARENGAYRLDGEKAWVSGAGVAGVAVVFARRGAGEEYAAPADASAAGAAGEDGVGRDRAVLSAFLVDLTAPGVRAGRPEETMGLRAAPVGALALDGVRLAPERRLGAEGSGFELARGALAVGRLGIAAQSLGIAGRCIDEAVAYARERRQFGRPIAEFQGVRLPLAELAARLEAARALLYRTAAERDAAEAAGSSAPPPDLAQHAAMAKLLASDLAMAAALQAVQTFGGYGYVKDYPVERFFRDAKAVQIYEGTNEIQRIVIARRLFDG